MFQTLKNAFKVKEIRNRLLYTFGMLIVIRFGSQLPVPGVNPTYLKDFFQNTIAVSYTHLDVYKRQTIGVVGNGEHALINIGKAGRKRHMGIRPTCLLYTSLRR